jgi:hypothetical protein
VVNGFRQVLFHLWILSLSLGSGHQSALLFALIQSCLVVLTWPWECLSRRYGGMMDGRSALEPRQL